MCMYDRWVATVAGLWHLIVLNEIGLSKIAKSKPTCLWARESLEPISLTKIWSNMCFLWGGGGGGGGSLVCVDLICLAIFGTVLTPGIPQKLLWAFALWSGMWWTNIQSWTLFKCCFTVILMLRINFADEPKPCWPSYGVTQGVWMGLLWGSVDEYEVPVEVSVTREPGSLLVPG